MVDETPPAVRRRSTVRRRCGTALRRRPSNVRGRRQVLQGRQLLARQRRRGGRVEPGAGPPNVVLVQSCGILLHPGPACPGRVPTALLDVSWGGRGVLGLPGRSIGACVARRRVERNRGRGKFGKRRTNKPPSPSVSGPVMFPFTTTRGRKAVAAHRVRANQERASDTGIPGEARLRGGTARGGYRGAWTAATHADGRVDRLRRYGGLAQSAAAVRALCRAVAEVGGRRVWALCRRAAVGRWQSASGATCISGRRSRSGRRRCSPVPAGAPSGRAVAGIRYATVVACGLCKVSYPRFVKARGVGSSAYAGASLAPGSVFGPAVLARVHLPAGTLWMPWLAVGLPLLVFVWVRRPRGRPASSRLKTSLHPRRRSRQEPKVSDSFAGATG